MVNASLRKQLEHAIRVSERQVIEDYKKFHGNLVRNGLTKEASAVAQIIQGERFHLGCSGR